MTLSLPSVAPISFLNGMYAPLMQPLPTATPFTYRSAATYTSLLEEMRAWLEYDLVPQLNGLNGTWTDNYNTLISTVDAAIAANKTAVDTAIAQAVSDFANANVDITDPVIAAVLKNAQSQTLAWLSNYTSIGPAPSGADDTAALTTYIAVRHTIGATVHLPAGTYLCNLNLAAQFPQVKIIGAGMRATILQAFDKTKPVVQFNGGSGGTGGGGLYEMTLQSATGANYEGIALAYSGTTGVKSVRVKIQGSFLEGVKFWNRVGNDFTEFNTFEGDISGCRYPVVYQVDNNVESFHGSGIEGNTIINIPTDNTNPVVDIRGRGLPYNAPLSFTVWLHSASSYLINYANMTAGRHCSFYGRIGIEGAPSADYVEMGQGNGGYPDTIMYAGTITWLGTGKALLGNIKLCRKIGYDGSAVTGDLQPFTTITTCKSGANNVVSDFEGGSISLVALTITAPNYEYHTVLAVQKSRFDGTQGWITEFGKTQFLDQNGKGAPVFSYSSGLVITNNNYDSTFSVWATVTPMGGGTNHYMMAQKKY